MEFTKMQGAGNDFIIVDNRTAGKTPEELSRMARILCTRRLSIGADGFMAVEHPTEGGDYKMRFYNSDGSVGEMCGNGARCIARWGHDHGLSGETQTIETTAGIVTGQRIDQRTYRVRLNEVTRYEPSLTLDVEGVEHHVSYVELGSPGLPHLVVEYPDLVHADQDALRDLGRALRSHKRLPKGANVNFFQLDGSDQLTEKTYERGVEDFTLACGTGTGSVVAALTLQGRVSGHNVKVTVPGGQLTINIVREGDLIRDLYLIGPTNVVAQGMILDEALPKA